MFCNMKNNHDEAPILRTQLRIMLVKSCIHLEIKKIAKLILMLLSRVTLRQALGIHEDNYIVTVA